MRLVIPKPVEYKLTKLDNGLQVLTKHFPNLQSIALSVGLRVGSVCDPVGQKGIAHFLEHMIFRGTTHLSETKLNRDFGSIGSTINAVTSQEYTLFHLDAFASTLGPTLNALASLLSEPAFKQKHIDKERQVILAELQEQISDAGIQADLLWDQVLYSRNPYSIPILGLRRNVETITKQQLQQFHEDYYGTANGVVCITGDVDHDKVVALVSKAFAKMPKACKKIPTIKVPKFIYKPSSHELSELKHGIIYRGKVLPTVDEIEKCKLGLLISLLGQGSDSLLFNELRTKQGLVYSASASYHSYSNHDVLEVAAACPAENYGKVSSTLDRLLNQLATKQVSRQRINIAKNRIFSSKIRFFDSIYCCSRLALCTIAGFLEYINTDVEVLKSLTSEQVRSLAKKYLTNLQRCAVMPPKQP